VIVLGMVAGLVLAALPGLALAAWGCRPAGRWRWAFALALAAPLGLAVTSALFFLYAVVFSPGTGFGYYVALEVLVGLVSLIVVRRVALERGEREAESRAASFGALGVLGVLVLVALVLSLGRFASEVLQNPDGRWDAWIDWNLRARFLYLGGEQWIAGFSPSLQVGHTEYPLLLPGAVARLWFYAGDATRLAPVSLAFVFTYGSIAVTGLALASLGRPGQGLLAAFTLACAPSFLEVGALQYADVPLAFFISSSIMLYCLHVPRRGADRKRESVVLGLSLGAAAWTKPEGLSFLACFLACWIVFEGVFHGQARRQFAKPSLWLAAGLLPALACLAILQIQFDGSNRFLSDRQVPEVIQKLTDPERYLIVTRAVLAHLWVLGGWRLGVIPLGLVALSLAIRDLGREESWAAAGATAMLALTALSYAMVYVISPQGPRNLLPTSLGRLAAQLYPAFIFLVFFRLESPLKKHSAVRRQAA